MTDPRQAYLEMHFTSFGIIFPVLAADEDETPEQAVTADLFSLASFAGKV